MTTPTPLQLAKQAEATARARLADTLSEADLKTAQKAIAARIHAEAAEAAAKIEAEAADRAELESLIGANVDGFRKEAAPLIAEQLELRAKLAASDRALADLSTVHAARFARRTELATKLGISAHFGPAPSAAHARACVLVAERDAGISPYRDDREFAAAIAALFENYMSDLCELLGPEKTVQALLDGSYFDQRREAAAAMDREGKRQRAEREAAAAEAQRALEAQMRRDHQMFESDLS